MELLRRTSRSGSMWKKLDSLPIAYTNHTLHRISPDNQTKVKCDARIVISLNDHQKIWHEPSP